MQATAHFQRLSQLFRQIQVSDRAGAPISLDQGARSAVEMTLAVAAASNKVLLIGNGGSAAIVSHMHSDLGKGAKVRALVFTEPPMLTAFSNDVGYQFVYERPVQLWGEPGDLLLAISSSGQSENILRAVRAAASLGCQVITLSGFRDDNPLRKLGDLNFYVPSHAYGEVEVAHSALAHLLTDSTIVAREAAEKANG